MLIKSALFTCVYKLPLFCSIFGFGAIYALLGKFWIEKICSGKKVDIFHVWLNLNYTLHKIRVADWAGLIPKEPFTSYV